MHVQIHYHDILWPNEQALQWLFLVHCIVIYLIFSFVLIIGFKTSPTLHPISNIINNTSIITMCCNLFWSLNKQLSNFRAPILCLTNCFLSYGIIIPPIRSMYSPNSIVNLFFKKVYIRNIHIIITKFWQFNSERTILPLFDTQIKGFTINYFFV